MTLRNSRTFLIRVTEGIGLESAVTNLLMTFDHIDINKVENMLSSLYCNRNMLANINIDTIKKQISRIYSKLPETTSIIWGVNFDNSLLNGTLRFATIMSGKDL